MTKLSAALSSLLQSSSSIAAEFTLASLSAATLRSLAALSGLSSDWINCDQKVPDNVTDLCKEIIKELYVPFAFYKSTIAIHAPRDVFVSKQATVPLAWHGKKKYWEAFDTVRKCGWLPKPASTFDATVHFLQGGSGTGVCVGFNTILTCAHVIDARDDDEDGIGDDPNGRVGRQKVVMFADGRVFVVKCVKCLEGEDGAKDVAACVIVSEVQVGADFGASIPHAVIRSAPIAANQKVFTVGNPSSIDLESATRATVEFTPACFHTSHGVIVNVTAKGFYEHCAWTYWGHSGAPLFDEEGKVCGLHCAWDEGNGVRLGQTLERLRECLDDATKEKSKTEKKSKKRKKSQEVIDLT